MLWATRYGRSVDLAQLVAFTNLHGDGVVSTLGPRGEPQSAYLSLAAMDDGSLVFDARADSRKIANLRGDGRVAVTVGGRDGASLQCEGIASLPVGEDRARCVAAFLERFPEFSASIDGGAVVVWIRPTWARFGEYVGTEFMLTDVPLSDDSSSHS